MSKTTAIPTLKALIDHPKTPPAERESAIRLLTRLLARVSQEAKDAYIDRRWYGENYDKIRGLSLVQIAKLIRADIKLARKAATLKAKDGDLALLDPIADAPEQIKVSVRTSYYSGGGSIEIYVCNVPEEWGWTTTSDDYGPNRRVPTEALTTLAKELKKIQQSYNHNGSDLTTDYHDVRFYGLVSHEDGMVLA